MEVTKTLYFKTVTDLGQLNCSEDLHSFTIFQSFHNIKARDTQSLKSRTSHKSSEIKFGTLAQGSNIGYKVVCEHIGHSFIMLSPLG